MEELAATRAEGIALMRVTVGFANDLVALKAAEHARTLVEWAHEGSGEQPDVAAMVAELRALAHPRTPH